MLIAAIVTNAVETAVFISPNRLAPKSWEITTDAPILLPIATAINIIVIG